MKTILGLLSTHYVERLSTFYFYNPPRVFWGLWTASKHLLPEVRGPSENSLCSSGDGPAAALPACKCGLVPRVSSDSARPAHPTASSCVRSVPACTSTCPSCPDVSPCCSPTPLPVTRRHPQVTRNKIKFIDPSDLTELQAGLPADVLPKVTGGPLAAWPHAL